MRRWRDAREGEILESLDGLFFDVKGLVHPPDRIVAFIRFYPNVNGNRIKGSKLYRKVYSLKDRYRLLKERYPRYLVYDPVFDEVLCEVPRNEVKSIHDPVEFLKEILLNRERLDELTLKALSFAEVIKRHSKIPWESIGVSGSVMIGLHQESSDIDIVVYGSKNCLAVYETMRELLEEEDCVRPYREEELKKLYKFRYSDTHMRYEDFERVERRKVTQGIYLDREFFIRFVKNFDEERESYGSILYKNCGRILVKAEVADSSDSIFTPCRYGIENVEVVKGRKVESITEIASFRGRFCDQAREGELIVAQGKLERVERADGREYHYRVLLGGSPEDYMIVVDKR